MDATCTFNTSLYIPLKGNLDLLFEGIYKQITILCLVTFRKHNFFSPYCEFKMSPNSTILLHIASLKLQKSHTTKKYRYGSAQHTSARGNVKMQREIPKTTGSTIACHCR